MQPIIFKRCIMYFKTLWCQRLYAIYILLFTCDEKISGDMHKFFMKNCYTKNINQVNHITWQCNRVECYELTKSSAV